MRFCLIHRVASGLVVLSMGLPSLLAQEAALPGEGGQAGQQQPENVPVALEGYCAVCLMRGHRWVKGKPEHTVVYDGRRYFFPGENEKKEFLRTPSLYAPVLNGDSVVAYASSGQRVSGNIRQATLQDGRLYLFQDEGEMRRFARNPETYARLDLAQPDKYAVDSTRTTTVAASGASCACGSPNCKACGAKTSGGSCSCGSKNCKACQVNGAAPAAGVLVHGVQQITVRGTTACASCKYGVPPLGAKKTLGLAVETNDGKVYIVEDADRLYPKIYEGRFQELPVELKGQILQTSGKFAWVKPTSVKVVR